MEHLSHAIKSTCELGFEKYYERLNAHVAAPGPLPPLLISGAPGSGKSLLLAKWIELQQHKASSPFVLYHFVGSPSACTADSTVMIRRLTSQLMQYVTSPPTLTCDPVRLIEEFPKWLEKVSAKFPSGLILVFDSADRLHNCESYLKFLLDPLPVDSRVIISVQDDTCPASWRSWPCLNLTELNTKAVKELSRAEMATLGRSLTEEQEGRILTYCRSPGTCCPLYVVLLANDLARCSADEMVDQRIDAYLKTSNCVQLYKALFDALQQEYETSQTKGFLKKALKYIYASRNGLCDHELFELIPNLSWNFWVPLCEALMERHILTRRSGLLICAHEQVRSSIFDYYMKSSDGSVLQKVRCTLRDYFASFKDDPEAITYRVADELPWINRQLEDRVALQESLVNLCIFVKLYARGRCEELVLHWLYVGVEKATMAQAYLTACKQLEDMVGQFNGLITLSKAADAYEALGRYLRDLGLLNEALAPLQRALEIRETALDPDHPSVAQSLHQVAGLHAQQGKFSTAEALYKHALEIYEGAFGGEHLMVAKELDALAVLYQKQGKHELADPLHKRALYIRRQCRAPQCSSSPSRRGDTLRKRVLQPEGLTMGPDSPDLARTLNEIGVLSYLQNNIEVSESFFKRALDIRERVLEADHPDVAQSMNNLAALYNDRKMYEEAEPFYIKALDIREKHFPNEHPNVVSIIKHLAMMYKKMKKFDKAEPLYQRLVDIRERLFDVNHPSVATAVVNWAVLCSEQGDHPKAQSLYERALKIYEESLSPTHPRVYETLKNLALCKYEQGEFESAASIYKRATEMREADPGSYATPAKGDAKRSRNPSGDGLHASSSAVLEKSAT
ncbi:hypothetical protein CAPTEDRAFT_219276 [Capitella teleta]|uniref:Nephrocystin-3 n=1 Tax=Capitella teleta TaxID=283909 RepID=R7T9W2_CAPTE|nr:hypothetical protein CAPTEDRAFT_219276 [Capitella teleta]|eukprot:ELT90543.1 hypothetical protein CAPTEDRAFT_219276 [Capitella teleta]